MQDEFRSLVSMAAEDTLDKAVTGGPHAEQAVRDKIAFIAFHEGYHMGIVTALANPTVCRHLQLLPARCHSQ
jgi:hypothetical protein